jgi:hypothetical protein
MMMAVVEPLRSGREQFSEGLKLFIGGLVTALGAGIVGPIVLAIIVGEIWGH